MIFTYLIGCLYKVVGNYPWNEVLSGDTTNIEGQVARYYFHTLFNDGFVRNTDKGGINSFLNYGYAIIRACVARFVVAGGLNPSFGIQHHNKLNPFCLVACKSCNVKEYWI